MVGALLITSPQATFNLVLQPPRGGLCRKPKGPRLPQGYRTLPAEPGQLPLRVSGRPRGPILPRSPSGTTWSGPFSVCPGRGGPDEVAPLAGAGREAGRGGAERGRRASPLAAAGRRAGGAVRTPRTQQAVGNRRYGRSVGAGEGTALTAASGLRDEWTVSDTWAGEFGGIEKALTPPPPRPPPATGAGAWTRCPLAAARRVPSPCQPGMPKPWAQC